MCLVFVGLGANVEYPAVVAFNRDEVYCRATRSAHWWEDAPNILGGRDLERHGTWAGISRKGRVAMLTFVRTEKSGTGQRSLRSRGMIVSEFLLGELSAEAYLEQLRASEGAYLPFNLICGELDGRLWHFNNLDNVTTALSPGVHGLSNATLNTPWPKVRRGREVMASWLGGAPEDVGPLWALMAERSCFADSELPRSGVSRERERSLSALFVEEPDYGTRTTTLLRLHRSGSVEFLERTHPTSGDVAGEVRYSWNLGS